jgi:hypothetical protein
VALCFQKQLDRSFGVHGCDRRPDHDALERRKRLYPWPSVIGLDGHFFRREPGRFRQFPSMVVDYKNRRLFELVEGRTVAEIEAAWRTAGGAGQVPQERAQERGPRGQRQRTGG